MIRPRLLVAAIALLVAGTPGKGLADPRNVLLIVADDVGVDYLGSYGELLPGAPTPPEHLATPNIDDLAAQGVRFRNVWSTPYCSATRAALLTGRYGFRTGVGEAVGNLPPSEVILPTILSQHTAHRHAALGKWHVTAYSPQLGPLHSGYTPVEAGFDLFRGSSANIFRDEHYFLWNKAIEERGGASVYLRDHTKYATTDTVDDALDWLAVQDEPWFLYLALHAVHAPRQVPPDELHTQAEVEALHAPGDLVEGRAVNTAMLEAMDTELGRLLAAVDPATTTILFVGDNGAPQTLNVPDRINRGGKGSLWEGGINVPLIVAGAGVTAPPGSEASTLAHVADLFATVLQLAGVPTPAIASPRGPVDSVSLVPALADPDVALRTTVYTDGSFGAGAQNPNCHQVAIRDPRYKLIRRVEPMSVELYDLALDPGERTNLLKKGVDAEQSAALERLYGALLQVTAGSGSCHPMSCGLGAELVLLTLPAWWVARRRHPRRGDAPLPSRSESSSERST